MKITKLDKEKRDWLLSVLKKDIKLLYSTISLGVLGAFLGLAVSIFSQKLIDDIVPSNDISYLAKGLSIVAGLIFLKIVVTYFQRYLDLKHGKAFNLRLIDKFFNKVLYLPKLFFDKHKTGGLIARMNDSGAIHQTITFITKTFILNVLILIVSASVLFYYSVAAGVIALLSFPFYLFTAHVFKDKLAQKNYFTMEANAQKESNYITTIQNIDLVKTHNKQETFSNLNNQSYGNYQNKNFDLGKTGMSLGIISEGIGTITYLVILSYASFQVVQGTLTVGEFTATLGIATGMLYPIGEIGMSILHLQGAKVAFDRMFELVSNKSEFDIKEDSNKEKLSEINEIEFKNVLFSYNQDNKLLTNLNFKITKGELTNLFGKNGTGKSTILNILMSVYQPTEGNVYYNGKNIKDLSLNHLREKIAIVSQQSKLFDRTVIDNICFDIDVDDKSQAVTFLNKMGFGEFINMLPSGYNTMVSENGKNLSGGQKQIIALARAMLKKPEVLLLDEPTASLDSDAEVFVMNLINEYSKTGIAVLISHKLKHAKKANTILVLEDGVIKKNGNHAELMQSDNLYSRSNSELVY